MFEDLQLCPLKQPFKRPLVRLYAQKKLTLFLAETLSPSLSGTSGLSLSSRQILRVKIFLCLTFQKLLDNEQKLGGKPKRKKNVVHLCSSS